MLPADLPPASPTYSLALHGPVSVGTGAWRPYTVRSGDTLYDLAREHGTTVAALVAHNDLPGGGRWIMTGTVIELPSGSPATASPGSANRAAGKQSTASGPKASSGRTGSPASGPARTVTVRPGDTLSHLSQRYDVSVASIVRANGLPDARMIHPGQQLQVPGSGSADTTGPSSAPRERAWTPQDIGDTKKDEDVPDTFLGYRYGSEVSRSAAANREYLAEAPAPSRQQVRTMVVTTAKRHGVDPELMLALSSTESGWSQRAVSPANAIGVMQVIPASGAWASGLVGRELNLLDPQDNITAGTVIMRALLRAADSEDEAIAGYYQGLAGVQASGMYADTKHYVRTVQAVRQTL